MAKDLQNYQVDMEDLSSWSSQRDLIAAVLSRAISDLLIDDEKMQAAIWIRSNKRSRRYITFLDACEALDLDPHQLRQAINRAPIKIIPRRSRL